MAMMTIGNHGACGSTSEIRCVAIDVRSKFSADHQRLRQPVSRVWIYVFFPRNSSSRQSAPRSSVLIERRCSRQLHRRRFCDPGLRVYCPEPETVPLANRRHAGKRRVSMFKSRTPGHEDDRQRHVDGHRYRRIIRRFEHRGPPTVLGVCTAGSNSGKLRKTGPNKYGVHRYYSSLLGTQFISRNWFPDQ